MDSTAPIALMAVCLGLTLTGAGAMLWRTARARRAAVHASDGDPRRGDRRRGDVSPDARPAR